MNFFFWRRGPKPDPEVVSLHRRLEEVDALVERKVEQRLQSLFGEGIETPRRNGGEERSPREIALASRPPEEQRAVALAALERAGFSPMDAGAIYANLGIPPTNPGMYQWDFPFFHTIPQTPKRHPGSMVSVELLRQLADLYDIARGCINHLKRECNSVKLDVVAQDPKDDSAATLAAIKEAKEHFLKRGLMGGIGRRRRHFEGMLFEDLAVVGAGAIWMRPNRAGGIYEVKAIDAGTIRPKATAFGAPDEGDKYEQWIQGAPVGAYTEEELIYDGLWEVSYQPYFKSPTEYLLHTINAAMQADIWNLSWLTDGTGVDEYMTLPEKWTPQMVEAWQNRWDKQYRGDLRQRVGVRFLPEGTTRLPQESRKDADFQEFMLWLMRRAAMIYGVQPASLGYVGEQYKSTQDESMQATTQFGAGDLLSWRKETYDDLLLRLGYEELEAKNVVETEEDAGKKIERQTKALAGGRSTLNEIRKEDGEEGIGPDGDIHFMPGTVVPLARMLNPQAGMPAPGTEPGQGGPEGGGPAPGGPEEGNPPGGPPSTPAEEQRAARSELAITRAQHTFGCLLARVAPEQAGRLRAWAEAHIPEAELAADGYEDKPHITVRYGFHDGVDADDVAELLGGRGPFAAVVGGITLFHGVDFDVVKLDVDSPELLDLHRSLHTLPHSDTHSGYRPHLTLAYVKAGEGMKYVGVGPLFGETLTFEALEYSPASGQTRTIPLVHREERAATVHYVASHALTAHNGDSPSERDLVTGWQNPPLTAAGEREAARLAERVRPLGITRVYASDLDRAAETGRIVAEALAVPLTLEWGLRPWHLGAIEGRESGDVSSLIRRLVVDNPQEPLPGGEPFAHWSARLRGTCERILSGDRRALLVTHSRCLDWLAAWIAGGPGDGFDAETFLADNTKTTVLLRVSYDQGDGEPDDALYTCEDCEEPEVARGEAAARDLATWRWKATRRMERGQREAFAFTSLHIPSELAARIQTGLLRCADREAIENLFAEADALLLRGAGFTESEHPRDQKGRFGSKGGAAGKATATVGEGSAAEAGGVSEGKGKAGSDPRTHAAGVPESMALSLAERDRMVKGLEEQIPSSDMAEVADATEQWRHGHDTFHLNQIEGSTDRDPVFIPSRRYLHNQILASPQYFGGDRGKVGAGERPEVILLAGAPASGKGGAFKGQYDESKYIVLNADEFKEHLPEYSGKNAATVHEESSYLMNQALALAISERRNIIIDGTLSNEKKWGAKVAAMRDLGYKTAGYHVGIPLAENLKRAVGRFKHSGRYVPLGMVAGEYNSYQTSFANMAASGLFDRWAKFDNGGTAPVKIAEGTGHG